MKKKKVETKKEQRSKEKEATDVHDSSGYKGVRTGFKRDTKTKEGDLLGLFIFKTLFLYICVHTHTHIYIYIYIYMCVCLSILRETKRRGEIELKKTWRKE